jgi:hypothetical protein
MVRLQIGRRQIAAPNGHHAFRFGHEYFPQTYGCAEFSAIAANDQGTVGGGVGSRKCVIHKAANRPTMIKPMMSYLSKRLIGPAASFNLARDDDARGIRPDPRSRGGAGRTLLNAVLQRH